MLRHLLPAALAVAVTVGGAAALANPQQDYMLFCMGCHGPEAQGIPGRVPPLAGTLARFMRSPEGRDYLLRVPGAANSALNDAQITQVLNWLADTYRASGDAPAKPFTLEEVTRSRHHPLANVQQRRRQVIGALAQTGPAPAPEY